MWLSIFRNSGSVTAKPRPRHFAAIARSEATKQSIHSARRSKNGLLRFARDDVLPRRLRPSPLDLLLHRQRLAPAVGRIIAVRTGDRVRLGAELAGEGEVVVRSGALAPAPKAVFPPIEKEIDPHLVMREGDFDLHLLAAGDAAVKGPGIVEDAMDHRVVLVRDRPGEFAADQEMRQVGEQLQIRKT